ncbi:DUF748 domain-containing protein [Algoriphagus confluentis]|uniref:AsmA-like C-terminal domain-containing protein n=1 Tax=Algoriphagus confluentis TaxID=1697556 RepID=A0ABQ6PTR0_9BACT|nr:hypothetical protein Aconfl_36790 [Algoriphagus confluentis]
MNKAVKILFFFFLIVILALLGAGFYAETWVNSNLASIINSQPERKYDLKFENADLDLFGKKIKLENITIYPAKELPTSYIEGSMREAMLLNVDLMKLVFQKIGIIEKLEFIQPDFIVHHIPDSLNQYHSANSLQDLFGDLLARGEIRNFTLENASASLKEGEKETGFLSNLTISVKGLATDSVLVKQLIPFQFDDLQIHLDSLVYQLKTGQNFHLGKASFDSKINKIKFEHIGLEYLQSLEKVSYGLDYQKDLINVRADSLVFFGIEANTNFYSDLDVRADKLLVAGLNLTDFRNKAKPRPPAEIKPMFQGMIQRLEFPLKLDTLVISNGHIAYGENVPQNGQSWQIHWDNLEGHLINLTSIPEFQEEFGHFDAQISGNVKGSGKLNFSLSVPYQSERFTLEVSLTDFDLTTLNSTLKPIMNGSVSSGFMDRLKLIIHASERSAQVDMLFDYRDLKVEMLAKKGGKKNIIVSSLANLALNHSNQPDTKNYLSPSFQIERNRYRGPFNLLWQSTKEGMMKIVPGSAVRTLLEAKED